MGRAISLFVLMLFVAQVAEAAGKLVGKIELVKGTVLILDDKATVVADPSGKRGRSTQVEAPFYEGETIQTKADGRVKLKFIEGGNVVVLGTDTSLVIERAGAQASNPGTSLKLARGEVRSQVNRKYSGNGGEVFEVKTANAVAGVRGTVFTSRFNLGSGKSEFATERGRVAVRGAGGGEVMVNPGMFTALASNMKTPTAPAPLSSNPGLQNVVDVLAGKEAKKDGAPEVNKEDSAGESRGPSPASNSQGDQASAAPIGREPVKSDAPLGREPASVGGVNASPTGADGMPRIMGDKSDVGRFDGRPAGLDKVDGIHQASERVNDLLRNKDRLRDQVQQGISGENLKGKVRFDLPQ